MDISDFTQDTSPTPATLKIHQLLHTTQLQRRQSLNEEYNSKIIAPKSTNRATATSQPSATTSSTATLKRKDLLQTKKSQN